MAFVDFIDGTVMGIILIAKMFLAAVACLCIVCTIIVWAFVADIMTTIRIKKERRGNRYL